METTLYFKLPNDTDLVTQLVQAVPCQWSWVDGFLKAPEWLIDSSAVAEKTGFALLRFHDIKPTIMGYDVEKRVGVKPDLTALLTGEKLPEFIHFDEAGFDNQLLTLEIAKQVACHYLEKEYRGYLFFYSDCDDNHKYQNPADCDFQLQEWTGPPSSTHEAGDQPARVRISWNTKFRGKEENVERVLALCREFELEEYTPQTTP